MDNGNTNRNQDSVYSNKVRAGRRRTYFFDVRQTKGDDFYVTLTESTKRFDREGYERHKIFLYKEDFNRFLEGLTDAIDHVKTELMPDYDYDEFKRRHEEYEAQRKAEAEAEAAAEANNPIAPAENESKSEESDEPVASTSSEEPAEPEEPTESSEVDDDDDMSW